MKNSSGLASWREQEGRPRPPLPTHAWVGPAVCEKEKRLQLQLQLCPGNAPLPVSHSPPGTDKLHPKSEIQGFAAASRPRRSHTPRRGGLLPCPAQPTCCGAEQRRRLAGCPTHVPFLEPLPAPHGGSLPGPSLPAGRGCGKQRQPPARGEPRVPATTAWQLKGSRARKVLQDSTACASSHGMEMLTQITSTSRLSCTEADIVQKPLPNRAATLRFGPPQLVIDHCSPSLPSLPPREDVPQAVLLKSSTVLPKQFFHGTSAMPGDCLGLLHNCHTNNNPTRGDNSPKSPLAAAAF